MNERNLTLLTDYYELTMMNGYFTKGMANKIAVFDLFFRTNAESNYCIAAGLQEALEYIRNLHFEEEEIEYLRKTGDFKEEFLEYLKNFKFTGDIYAVEEGTVVFPHEPLLIIKAPIMEAQLVESALLNIVNFETLIATKASRITSAAAPGVVIEFGLRRAQAPDAAIYGARAAIMGGCASTSNVLAAQMFGYPPKGTHAHSWIMSFDTELEAFRAYAEIYPNSCLLLVDTYDTLNSGLPNAITVFKEMKEKGLKPVGIRLDSGDLAYFSKKARQMLDEAGLADVKIFAGGDLDEYIVTSLKLQGAKIDMYGIGTKLITSFTNPSLGGVYKLCAIEDETGVHPKMKISDNHAKVTNPGEKRIYRFISKTTGKALADVICLADEVIDETKPYRLVHPVDRWKTKIIKDFKVVPLHKKVVEQGRQIYQSPSLAEIRKYSQNSLDEFWEEYKRIEKPQLYKVNLSDKLYDLKQSILASKSK